MQNPWLHLPENAPFVLSGDRQMIQDFNERANDQYHIHLELLPEPYLGCPQAKIILLNLNPGFDEKDILSHRDDPYFAETNRVNLLHKNQEYPFYLLNPKNALSSGSHWWQKKLKTLIGLYGFKKLANEICVMEYFPYHSAKFGFRKIVPSQSYNFYLVTEAMKRNALIIQMRSQAEWQKALPFLKDYQNYYILRNPQNTVITERNCPDGYPEILKALG